MADGWLRAACLLQRTLQPSRPFIPHAECQQFMVTLKTQRRDSVRDRKGAGGEMFY